MIAKVAAIGWREFSSTVLTKAFLIGALVVPAIFALLMPLVVRMLNNARAPEFQGTVLVLDQTGVVGQALTDSLSTEGLTKIVLDMNSQLQAQATAAIGIAPALSEQLSDPVVQSLIVQSYGPLPEFETSLLGADTDLDAVRESLAGPKQTDDPSPVALVVIAPDAVQRTDEAGPFGGFQLQVRAKTDDRHIGLIRRALRASILEARYERAGVDADELTALTTVVSGETEEITEAGDVRRATSELNMLIPFGFMILLMVSVMVGGQYLLTTTVEEKSSRVVEVLLSAVSPMQLMTGKILGQMGVGVLLLGVYLGTGIAALSAFSLLDLISVEKVLLVIMYFVLAYIMIASLMAAIGSAVNEMREAQSLMTPVMMTLMVPYLFAMPIARDPDSIFAVVLSMLPPMSPFAMVIRITSTEPPPLWQVALSLAITAAFALGCIWFAAKVFRVGLLMFGKPPNFKTLIRWVRMA